MMKVLTGVLVVILGLFFASLCTYILVGHFFYGKFPLGGNSIFSDVALGVIFGATSIVGIIMIVVGVINIRESTRKLLRR